MGILAHLDYNCNATLNKIPDYAKDYKNEYLFIRSIDKSFDNLESRLFKGDKEIFKSHRVEKIKRLINGFEKAQKLGYLKDISDKDIWENDVHISFLLLDSLIEMGDYYYNYNIEYDRDQLETYEKLLDADFPGYIDFVRCVELFHSKFKIREIEIDSSKVNWHDSDSDGDSDFETEIDNIFS